MWQMAERMWRQSDRQTPIRKPSENISIRSRYNETGDDNNKKPSCR